MGGQSIRPRSKCSSAGWDTLAWSLRLDVAGLFVPVDVARGRLGEARELLAYVPEERRAESQERAGIAIGRAALARGERRFEQSLELLTDVVDTSGSVGPRPPALQAGHRRPPRIGGRARRPDGGRIDLRAQVRALKPAQRSPMAEAQLARYDAHVAARDGDAEAA